MENSNNLVLHPGGVGVGGGAPVAHLGQPTQEPSEVCMDSKSGESSE